MIQRDERGSFAPMTALLLTVLVGFTAFAVDLGLQRAAARDMQAVADVVALDTARSDQLTSCNDTALSAVANSSFARQTSDPIGETQDLEAVAGHLDTSAGGFIPGAGPSGCDAVKIWATTEVGFAFAPAIGTDSGTATRTAVGTSDEPAVCFAAGTKALTLNSTKSALSPLLNRILEANLDVGSYAGLIDLKSLQVPLADLATELGVGTAQELIDTDVTLGAFMLATANVLRGQGNIAQADVLESVAAQVGDLTLEVAKILALDTGGDAGLNANIDALDLIGTAVVGAAIANGENAVSIEAGLGLPLDLVEADSRLILIEPPQIACGPVGTVARTAQVRLDTRTSVNVLGLLSAATLDLGVRVAPGEATLTDIKCTAPQTTTIVGTTSLLTLTGRGGTGQATLKPVSLLGISLITVPLSADFWRSPPVTHTFNYPPAPGGDPKIYGGGSRLILKADTGLNSVLSVVNRLTDTLDLLIRPLLKFLGIEPGIMEVSMLGTPSCDGVRLAG